jgi:hypothetical protein
MENSLKMENHHTNDGGIGSILIGFVLAIGNQVFGWMNTILEIHTIHWTIQAVVVGILGSTASYFTNKIWKWAEKKIFKSKKNKDE